MIGRTFSRLSVVTESLYRNRSRSVQYWCMCTCGEFLSVTRQQLLNSGTKSCGCLRREIFCAGNYSVRHGQANKTGAYNSWKKARERCLNPRNNRYELYGGRGIKFLFNSFEAFYAELGNRPPGMSVDRINNNGHYEKGNVRWATPLVQGHNRRISKHDIP